VASVANAEQKFGDAGIMVPSGSVSLDYSSSKPPEGDKTSETFIGVAPGLLVFVTENFAVGGRVALSRWADDEDSSSLTFGMGPVVGLNVPLGDNLSLFPQFAIFAAVSNYKNDINGETFKTEHTTGYVYLEVPVLYHVQNFFMGAGPYFATDMVSKYSVDGGTAEDGSKDTSLGLSTTIGGWF